MNFHWPSFLMGYAAGAGTVLAAKQLRPLLLELAAGAYRIADAAAARLAMSREDFDDLLAEAKSRVSGPHAKREETQAKRRTASGARRTPRRKTPRALRAVPA